MGFGGFVCPGQESMSLKACVVCVCQVGLGGSCSLPHFLGSATIAPRGRSSLVRLLPVVLEFDLAFPPRVKECEQPRHAVNSSMSLAKES